MLRFSMYIITWHRFRSKGEAADRWCGGVPVAERGTTLMKYTPQLGEFRFFLRENWGQLSKRCGFEEGSDG